MILPHIKPFAAKTKLLGSESRPSGLRLPLILSTSLSC